MTIMGNEALEVEMTIFSYHLEVYKEKVKWINNLKFAGLEQELTKSLRLLKEFLRLVGLTF